MGGSGYDVVLPETIVCGGISEGGDKIELIKEN